MRPKDRVLAAINHQPTDRVPVNFAATAEIIQQLTAHLELSTYEGLLERLGVDLRSVAPRYTGPDRGFAPDGSKLDVWGVGYSSVEFATGRYSEATYLPFAEFEALEDVESYPWPSPDWYDYSDLAEQCRRAGNYAAVLGSPGVMDLINGTARGRGVEQTLLDIGLEDPIGLACMQKRQDFYLELMTRSLEAADGLIDILFVGDDYGSQRSLLMSRQCWRKLFQPKLRQFAELAASAGIPLMLHSCGSNRLIMADLIETGVSIYDTVQPEAAGMAPAELKALFGDRMAWHGTVSTQQTLPFGSAADVEAEVHQRIEIVGRHGGLILAPAHNIQPDTPLENVLTMYRAAGSFAACSLEG